jgi:hypothetical protein
LRDTQPLPLARRLSGGDLRRVRQRARRYRGLRPIRP